MSSKKVTEEVLPPLDVLKKRLEACLNGECREVNSSFLDDTG